MTVLRECITVLFGAMVGAVVGVPVGLIASLFSTGQFALMTKDPDEIRLVRAVQFCGPFVGAGIDILIGHHLLTPRADRTTCLVDPAAGTWLAGVAVVGDQTRFSPDGTALIVFDSRGVLRVWDFPPRKPLGWFALAAAILALPLTGLAWRRSRRLRREAA
jgi:hypothetical protein